MGPLFALLVSTATVSTATTSIASVSTSTTSALSELRESGLHEVLYKPEPQRKPWSQGDVRTFIATTVDFGYLYLRPRASLGYGRPHSLWAGAEVNPIFSTAGIGGYVGVRAAAPFADVRFGARGFYAFERTYLPPAEHFDRYALATSTGRHAAYLTYETEANASALIGPGEINGLFSLSYVDGVPKPFYIYEETLHAVVKPPWVWRVRGGYNFFFALRGREHSFGAVVDVVGLPLRDTELIRAGFVFRISISPSLEVRGTFVPTLWSQDRIGILGGDFTELGFRWRWSTD